MGSLGEAIGSVNNLGQRLVDALTTLSGGTVKPK